MRHQSSRLTHLYTRREVQNTKGRKDNTCAHTVINVHIHYVYRSQPTNDGNTGDIQNHNPYFFSLEGWWKSKTGKKMRKKKRIATMMSSIISFFSASHFKDGIWRIYSSESLKHSWDVLKSMLQARQKELESLSSGLQRSLSSSCQMSKWKLMKWGLVGPLASSSGHIFIVFRLFRLQQFVS